MNITDRELTRNQLIRLEGGEYIYTILNPSGVRHFWRTSLVNNEMMLSELFDIVKNKWTRVEEGLCQYKGHYTLWSDEIVIDDYTEFERFITLEKLC